MNLAARIETDLKTAMIGRDALRVETLRGLRAAILNEEVAKGVRDSGLDDSSIEQIIYRECKKRDEAAELFERGGNHASSEKERSEKTILSTYLPEQLSNEELGTVIDEVMGSDSSSNPQIGAVIGAVKARVGTTADGARIAAAVRAKLSSE